MSEIENPTNEDNSIDDAINDLFEEANTDTESKEPEKEESVAEDKSDATETEETNETDKTDDTQSEAVVEADAKEEGSSLDIPEHMPADLKESLNTIEDDTIKQTTIEVFNKLHNSYSAKKTELADGAKFADEIKDVFIQNGINVDNRKQQKDFINRYVAFDNQVNTDPIAAIVRIMEYAKVKPEDLGIQADPIEQGSDPEYDSDTEKRHSNQIKMLNEKYDKLESQQYYTQDQAQLQAVNEFRNAKNDKGELKYPYFEQAKPEMISIAKNYPKLDVNQLYHKAIRLNDEIYNEMLEKEKSRHVNDLDTKRKAEVEKAKKLNKQSVANSNEDTMTDNDEAHWDKIGNEWSNATNA